MWILLGAVGFLLSIACANVANLFLVRAEVRHGEVAIRAARGESSGRLAASVLVESLALGVAGGLAALLLAQGAVRLLIRFGPPELPRLEEISVDANVLLFCIAVSVAAGLLFGLLPAWHAGAVAASVHMTAGARAATSGRDRQLVRRGLVVVQMGWLRRCSSGLDWPWARSSGWRRSTPDSIRSMCSPSRWRCRRAIATRPTRV